MGPNDSRHLLPMSSTIFRRQTSVQQMRQITNPDPSVVNLQEARDETVTALPFHMKLIPTQPVKESKWERFVRKMKSVFRLKKKVKISAPTNFRHLETGSSNPLLTPVTPGVKKDAEGTAVEEGDDLEWEDPNETRVFGRK